MKVAAARHPMVAADLCRQRDRHTHGHNNRTMVTDAHRHAPPRRAGAASDDGGGGGGADGPTQTTVSIMLTHKNTLQ